MAAPSARVTCWGTSSGRSCTVTCQPPSGVGPAVAMSPPRLTSTPVPSRSCDQPGAAVGGDGLGGGAEVELGAGRHRQPAALEGQRAPAGRTAYDGHGAPVAAYQPDVAVVAEADQHRAERRVDGAVGLAGGVEGDPHELGEQRAELGGAVLVADERHQLAVGAEPAARVLDPGQLLVDEGGGLVERRASVTTRRHAVLQSSQSRAVGHQDPLEVAWELLPVPVVTRELREALLGGRAAASCRSSCWCRSSSWWRSRCAGRPDGDDAAGGGQRGRHGAADDHRAHAAGAAGAAARVSSWSMVMSLLVVVGVRVGVRSRWSGPGRTRRCWGRPAGRRWVRAAGSAGPAGVWVLFLCLWRLWAVVLVWSSEPGVAGRPEWSSSPPEASWCCCRRSRRARRPC